MIAWQSNVKTITFQIDGVVRNVSLNAEFSEWKHSVILNTLRNTVIAGPRVAEFVLEKNYPSKTNILSTICLDINLVLRWIKDQNLSLIDLSVSTSIRCATICNNRKQTLVRNSSKCIHWNSHLRTSYSDFQYWDKDELGIHDTWLHHGSAYLCSNNISSRISFFTPYSHTTR